MAQSSLPPHLQEAATLYVLDPKAGFKMARPGTNGFHAFVARNEPGIYQGEWPHTEYADLLIPMAFDSAGVDTHMKAYFDLAEMRAQGIAPEEAKRILQERYRSEYKAPERPGIAYMLAPIVRGYRRAEQGPDITTFSLPHYMFYAPDLTDEDIGAGNTLAHPFVLSRKPGPHGLIIVLAGKEERRAIQEEYAELLTELCKLDEDLCLSPRRPPEAEYEDLGLPPRSVGVAGFLRRRRRGELAPESPGRSGSGPWVEGGLALGSLGFGGDAGARGADRETGLVLTAGAGYRLRDSLALGGEVTAWSKESAGSTTTVWGAYGVLWFRPLRSRGTA